MDKVEQFAPLTMGWCLDCHRGKTTPKNVLQTIYKENPSAQDPNHRYIPVAPTSCSTCHH
jgi:hypothetical protein